MIQIKEKNAISIIDVPFTNIDIVALEQLKNLIESLFDKNKFYIIINLSKVEYLSSTGLGLLVYINNKCTENSGGLAIFGLQDYTMDMIKLTQLDSVLNIFATQQEAEKAFTFLI